MGVSGSWSGSRISLGLGLGFTFWSSLLRGTRLVEAEFAYAQLLVKRVPVWVWIPRCSIIRGDVALVPQFYVHSPNVIPFPVVTFPGAVSLQLEGRDYRVHAKW